MFNANFLSRIYNRLPRDDYAKKDVSAEKDVSHKDNLGDHWPIHDPTIKWKLMRPVLGEKYESPEQLKRALVFYAKKDMSDEDNLVEIRMSFQVDVFVNAYNHYIEGMNGMDQWSTTGYQKPLPPIVRRMPRRPAHKRKGDAMEDDGNKTRIRTTSVKKVTASGEIVTASIGKVMVAGETVTASGGNVTASDDLVSARGGNVTARGGNVSIRGGKVTARGICKGWKVTLTPSTPSTPPPGFEMSTSNIASSVVRTNRGAIKLREGVWIRSHKKERSSYADTRSSRINKLRMVNVKVVSSRGRGDGSKSRMYPFAI
ncbi:hypothetical protein Tco_1340506, partial [Tanacetum coccineum]